MGLTKPRAYQIYDIDYKQAVRVVTVANVTLTGGAPNSVDGVNLTLNDRILVTGQSTGSQNGIYYVTTLGSGANGTWARSTDTNATGELLSGTIVMVTEGVVYKDTQWKLITDDPITIGSTALTFVQNYSTNSISAGTSNVVVNSNANVTVSSAGTANVLIVTSTGSNVAGYITATGNITGGNIRSTTGCVYGIELYSTFSSGDEGGQLNLALAATNTTLVGGVTVDMNQNRLRFFETGGTNRGAYIDLTAAATGVGTNLLAGGGGGTPGGSNTQIQFNDAGTFGGTAGLTFNKTTNAVATTGTFTATGNISGGNLSGTGITGTLLTAAQTNITSVGTLTSLSVTGNISGGNVSGTRGAFTNVAGTLETATQTNITSVGTLSSLTVTANVAGGNLTTAGQVVATGNISGGNLLVTGNIVDSGALSIITASNGNITLAPNGTGVVVVNTDLRNGQATGVGNIGASGATFNTIFAKATSAQYADLAEMYVSDADYSAGTVVEFGGKQEITISTQSHSTAVAGIISTNPSYLMNSTQTGEHVLPVALTGRVPCRVQGPVRKGDVLVASSTPGVAQRIGMNWQPGCVVGKSMENITEATIKTIEVAVGRL